MSYTHDTQILFEVERLTLRNKSQREISREIGIDLEAVRYYQSLIKVKSFDTRIDQIKSLEKEAYNAAQMYAMRPSTFLKNYIETLTTAMELETVRLFKNQ